MSNRNIERNLKGNENEPKLRHIVRGQTAEEEFVYIMRLIGDLSRLRQSGYNVVLPQIQPFIDLDDQSLPRFDERELFNTFLSQEYDPSYYKPAIAQLEPKLAVVERKISQPFDTWSKSWGFITFPSYQVRLTKYGTGGDTEDDTGSIIMRITSDGSFSFPFPIENNTIHEEIHLGVDKTIVEPYGLSDTEKEILVNRMCMVQFGGSYFDYSSDDRDYTHLSIYHAVNPESLLCLPQAISAWANTRN